MLKYGKEKKGGLLMPDSLSKFLFQPKKFEEILPSAKVVIDTNFLLSGYQYRGLTFREIIDTLTKLNEQERLIIPSHVLKEFFRRRADKIVELIQLVQQHRDKIQNISHLNKIEKVIPNQEFTSIHEQINEMEDLIKNQIDELNKNLKNYRNLHSELIEEFKSYFNEDPILNMYSPLFKHAYYKPEDLPDEEHLIKEFNEVRKRKKMPPGYKDGTKNNGNEAGDYIIWAHILEIKDDVIFITGDNKPDWVYTEPGSKKVISARRELVEEFYAKSGGKTFCIVSPATFIEKFNPDAESTVLDELSKQNTKSYIENKISNIQDAIMALNDEGNSLAANSRYAALMKTLFSLSEPVKYRKGTNGFLDFALSQISNDRPLFDEVISKANKIANNSKLTIEEKNEMYESLANWTLTNQDL